MLLQQIKTIPALNNPVFRVITTWFWLFISSSLIIISILLINRITVSIPELIFNFPEVYREAGKIINPYFMGSFIEFIAVGFLPLVFTIICNDDIKIYGIIRKGFIKSLFYSLLFVVVAYTGPILTGENPFQFGHPNLRLGIPWNLLFVVTVAIIHGPVEVFFVIWLIANTDRIFNTTNRIFSLGLIITPILFGISNMFFEQNIFSALLHVSTFFIFGLIYKFTKNSIGPMIGFTLGSGYTWKIASLLWI